MHKPFSVFYQPSFIRLPVWHSSERAKYQAYKTVSPHLLLHIPGSDSWLWSQCQCQRLKTTGPPSLFSNHKLSSSLKHAPDGNGVRLWKNHVDRIQDPVKGPTLTRRILASGCLLRLHPIPLFLSPSSISSSLPSVSLSTGTGKIASLLIYLSTHYDSSSHFSPTEDFFPGRDT